MQINIKNKTIKQMTVSNVPTKSDSDASYNMGINWECECSQVVLDSKKCFENYNFFSGIGLSRQTSPKIENFEMFN